MHDFDQCAPGEFYRVAHDWLAQQEQARHEGWEQVRMLALATLAPWAGKELTPRDVMRFPWEEEGGDGGNGCDSGDGCDSIAAPSTAGRPGGNGGDGCDSIAASSTAREAAARHYREVKKARGLI